MSTAELKSWMAPRRDDVALLVARVAMASLFVMSGIEKIIDFQGASAFAASKGIPLAQTLMPCAIVLELSCAAMLITGWKARPAALVLAGWMFVLNPWFHPFWTFQDRMIGQLMLDDFFHHFVMIGGMIYVAVFGPGRLVLVGRPRT